ncbi:MAG: hypothetical protein CVV42_16220 [Candidatus Riflebacteria bacterium HGW-Riflebacteria-2]|jgi:hypothetical protein|nr:MAG: hypothetical protein CVV42_16220 [Candidatus Riflebacteria bacterium HGW-Riflebacteria-2]
MVKKIAALTALLLAFFLAGCDKTGQIKEPLPPYSYVTPTIQSLDIVATTISKTTGGIMKLSCEWTSPSVVSTATAYLGFVRTIQDVVTEPVGVIASDTASKTSSLLYSGYADARASSNAETEAFYQRFKDPIAIPTKIGTENLAGQWGAEIPFTPQDIYGAPLGVHQMILYMSINGVKTNTLAFEMTFTE